MFFINTVEAASRTQQNAQAAAAETQSGIFDFFTTFLEAIPWWIGAGIIFWLSFYVATMVKKMVVYKVTANNEDLHQEVVILIERAVYFGIVLLGGVIALKLVKIDVSSLIGFLGFGIGFAFKDLLANFIAGVVILTQKKFKINDTVKINGNTGKIKEIDVRTTQVQSLDGTNLIIPNADMLTAVIQNFTSNSFRRISFQVGVHYETPLAEAIELTKKSVKKHKQVTIDPAPQVLAVEFADSAITLEVRFWVESTANWPLVQSELIQALKKEYDIAGISIPFPIRTLTLDEYDRNLLQAVHVPIPDKKFDWKALVQNPVQTEQTAMPIKN